MVIMFSIHRSNYFVASAFALTVASSLMVTVPARAAPLDENISISYTALGTSINWQTAGAVSPPSSGTLGPFSRACAILEGKPHTNGNVMTRSVFVLDAGNGAPNTVVLHVHTRTDTITSSGGVTSDVETIVPRRQVVLSLISQVGNVCYMAANDISVFASTSANNQASIVNKTTFAETTIQSYVTNYNSPVTQITAADEGVVFVTFGTGPTAGFAEFNNTSQSYLAAGQNFNFTVLAGTANATTF
jgi:hypothetical protein